MCNPDLPGYGLSVTSDCYLAGDIGGTKTVLALFGASCHGFEQLETSEEGEECYLAMIQT
jgi:glucokinase